MLEQGFIKVAAATPRIKVADCMGNAERIIACIKEADAAGAALIVLPELCITGYTAGDLFLQQPLQRGATAALQYVLEATGKLDIVAVLGLPLVFEGALYNCAAVIQQGRLLGVVPKSHLPNYGEFYELRHFEPAPKQTGELTLCNQTAPFGTRLLFSNPDFPLFTLAVEICEDLWVAAPPSVAHAEAGAFVIANLSASNEVAAKDDYRRLLLTAQSARLMAAYVYADAGEGESTTDMVFAGHNLIAEHGVILAESELFKNGVIYADIDLLRLQAERLRGNTFLPQKSNGYLTLPLGRLNDAALSRSFPRLPFVPQKEEGRAKRCQSILDMQAQGLAARMRHINCEKLVIGVSGGLDSTLALLVCSAAMKLLGKPNSGILAYTLPCFGTTKRTRGNAEILSGLLGVSFACIDIGPSVKQHLADIGLPEGDRSVAFENAQARERTQVLMDIANKEGALVVGTGDLSELALGFATYGGDHISMYGVNVGVPKTLVRYLVRHAAEQDPALSSVLLDILDTPVSPELLPDAEGAQHTEDIVGPYELHDFFIYHMLRFGHSPARIFYMAQNAFAGEYDTATIKKWLRIFYKRFFAQQFKRSCLPDGPKVGSVSLSPRGDWRMPSDACGALWLNEVEGL